MVERHPGYIPAMARRVIVVPTASVPEPLLQSVVRQHAGEGAEIHVVAPASKISRLDWLTNAEDDARADAQDRAEETAAAVPSENVDTHVGDTDPLLAIEDALRQFPADEVIVVTRPGESTWLEDGVGEAAQRRLDIPVVHLVAAD